MKLASLAALAALGIALSGCATIIKGTTQSIAVTTPPVEGATCTLTSKEGSWTVVTPGVAKVHKTKDDIQARCVKPGYQDGIAYMFFFAGARVYAPGFRASFCCWRELS